MPPDATLPDPDSGFELPLPPLGAAPERFDREVTTLPDGRRLTLYARRPVERVTAASDDR